MSNVLYVLVFFKLFVILIHSKSKKYLVETEDGEQMGGRRSYKYNVTPPSDDKFKCEMDDDCSKPGKLCEEIPGGPIPIEKCLCVNNKCCSNIGDGTCGNQATPRSYDKFKCEKDDDCSKPGKLCEVIPGGPIPTEGCHCVNNKCCGDIGDGTCGNQVTPPSYDKFKCEKDDDCSKPGKLCEVKPLEQMPDEGCHCVDNKCCFDRGDGICQNQGYCKHPHKNIDRRYKDGESFNYCCNICGCDCKSNSDCGASCTEKGCSCGSCKKEEECNGYMGMSAMCYWNNKKGCISKTKGGSYYDRHGGNGSYKG